MSENLLPSKASSILSRKVAGVPVMAIVGVIGLGILYAVIKMKPTPDPAPTADTPTGDSNPDESQPVFQARPVESSDAVSTSVTQTQTQDTNDLWGRRAVGWLIAQGTDITIANSAVRKFLNGDALSFEEGQARDAAVKQFGIPPEDITFGSVASFSGQATKQGVPPTTHTVKGTRDDTYGELGLLYYGSNSGDALDTLQAANLALGAKGPFAVGTRITIPKFSRPKYYRATTAARTVYAIAAKNGTSAGAILQLNDGMKFPVKVGTRVRVA
jgi:hypothetical protein